MKIDERMAITAELRDAYDSVAEAWHLGHRADDWWVEGAERFVVELPPRARVLDVGCGGGTKARWLSDRGFRVTGVDISEKLLDIARGEAHGAEFRSADMCDLPFDLKDFDGVFAQATLLHVPRVETVKTLEHWRGRMKRGGLLHVAVKGHRVGPFEERKIEVIRDVEITRFFSYFTLEELRYKAMLAGFVTSWSFVKPSGRVTWLQVVAKNV